MGSTTKTQETEASVTDFINSIDNDVRRKDGFALLELHQQITGETPKMWGTSIIGFGKYHYKSEKSRQEGDMPLVGFSPRKSHLSFYLSFNFEGSEDLFAKLGKHKKGSGCLNIIKLADVDLNVLEKIVSRSYQHAKATLS